MSKKKIGAIFLSVFIFIIVVISSSSFSNMNDIKQIEEYAESLKEPKDHASSYMGKVVPTLDDFRITLNESQDIETIFFKFGEPHRDIGSGIHIYVYELNDFSEIWIGYVEDILYVKHMDADGNKLEELFVKTIDDCSGTARCITGTVTSVIDGDTIKVDGQTIRFALVDAPELKHDGGQARNFVEEICPVGSTVVVDQDDSQLEDKYGRILGVIYCNDLNLNKELLDSGLGDLYSAFCDQSEFKDSDWAVKHGC